MCACVHELWALMCCESCVPMGPVARIGGSLRDRCRDKLGRLARPWRLRIFALACDELTCEGATLLGCGLAAGVNSWKLLRVLAVVRASFSLPKKRWVIWSKSRYSSVRAPCLQRQRTQCTNWIEAPWATAPAILVEAFLLEEGRQEPKCTVLHPQALLQVKARRLEALDKVRGN
jgi:hypothetical protein